MFKPAIGRRSPRLPAFALAAALGVGALTTACTGGSTPTPDQPSTSASSQPYRYVGPYERTGETPPVRPAEFEAAEETLAWALCGELAQRDQHPGAVLSGYEDRYDELKDKYKLNGPNDLGKISLQLVAGDYCPEQIGIFGSSG